MSERFDVVVIGSGPGGQKAAICAAKAGKRVAIIEQDRLLGGACVHYGTIPSKALRDAASRPQECSATSGERGLELRPLLSRVADVVKGYARTVEMQMRRNDVTPFHGRASFVSAHELSVARTDGSTQSLEAEFVIIAAGSKPRHPENMPIDHEHILDSDSILKLAYLPRSMIVLGAGVIACEYASIFARLGVEVALIDRAKRPLNFVEEELVTRFVHDFENCGGRYRGNCAIEGLAFDGVSGVELTLDRGDVIRAEKALVALGRTGCLDKLNLAAAGLEATARGTLEVDDVGATSVPHIYAVGDVAGPPALATSAMEQGRRAARAALGLPRKSVGQLLLPTGIYTLPEIASVGKTEKAVRDLFGEVTVGRAHFEEVARGQISDFGSGMLKLVADPDGEQILGVHAVGEGASELIHIGQMAILGGARVDDLLDNVFNFPTLAEAYRLAALNLKSDQESVKPDFD